MNWRNIFFSSAGVKILKGFVGLSNQIYPPQENLPILVRYQSPSPLSLFGTPETNEMAARLDSDFWHSIAPIGRSSEQQKLAEPDRTPRELSNCTESLPYSLWINGASFENSDPFDSLSSDEGFTSFRSVMSSFENRPHPLGCSGAIEPMTSAATTSQMNGEDSIQKFFNSLRTRKKTFSDFSKMPVTSTGFSEANGSFPTSAQINALAGTLPGFKSECASKGFFWKEMEPGADERSVNLFGRSTGSGNFLDSSARLQICSNGEPWCLAMRYGMTSQKQIELTFDFPSNLIFLKSYDGGIESGIEIVWDMTWWFPIDRERRWRSYLYPKRRG